MRDRWWLAAVSTLLTAYLVFAVLLGQTVLGAEVRLRHGYLAGLAVAVAVLAAPWGRRVSSGVRQRLTMLIGSTLLMLLAVDTVFTWRENRRALTELEDERRDPTIEGDLPAFYPTERGFAVYKPGIRVSAERYGNLYASAYRRSPTLVRDVLERRRVSIAIDADGFRSTGSLSTARIFALGDSFTYGPTIDQEKTWPEMLSTRLGEPVYNLGIDGASPATEHLVLEHVVRSKGATVRHLLWMIFEGNDLDELTRTTEGPLGDPLRTTVLGALAIGVPTMVNETSVLGRLHRGELRLAGRSAGSGGTYRIDGVDLAVPLYRSARLGAFLVYPPDVDAAGQTESALLRHAARARLDATFAEMRALASAGRFDVTVVVAPSLPRLYAAELSGAVLSEKAHFADYVLALARRLGFGSVNLVEEMRPYAAREMLYFRDDTHWNERGNRVAAEIIARRVFGR
jgi:hypothetical protein